MGVENVAQCNYKYKCIRCVHFIFDASPLASLTSSSACSIHFYSTLHTAFAATYTMLPTMHWLHLLPIISAAAAILLPAPNGRFPVSASVHSLTDESRMDPYAPANKRHKRKVLTSLYLPIQGKNTKISKRKLPYMTPAVAEDYGLFAEGMGLPNTTFASFEIETSSLIDRSPPCSGRHSSTKGSHKVPLVLFSPGSGQSRLLYTTMAMSLASEGYAVLTIDHPYDAPVVEFPDGTIIRAVEISDEDTKALEELVQVSRGFISPGVF